MSGLQVKLDSAVMRGLGDASYEKRKVAALEIEKTMAYLVGKKENKMIVGILTKLKTDFVESSDLNKRKGGLIGFAAATIGMMKKSGPFLKIIVPSVIVLFKDPESRVRYYACEALYNILKVSRGNMLPYFTAVFDGLCTLYVDRDKNVRSGAQLLDQLLKDIVVESDYFDILSFIELLTERSLTVGWVSVLDKVPDINILMYLPRILGGVFEIMSDPGKHLSKIVIGAELRQKATVVLSDFLPQLEKCSNESISQMVPTLVFHCVHQKNSANTRLMGRAGAEEKFGQDKPAPESKNENEKQASPKPLYQHLFIYFPSILNAILQCSSSKAPLLVKHAKTTDSFLRFLIKRSPKDLPVASTKEYVDVLLKSLKSHIEEVRVQSLDWISVLLDTYSQSVIFLLWKRSSELYEVLGDKSQPVVRKVLNVISKIAKLQQQYFTIVLQGLFDAFYQHPILLETRAVMIVQELSKALGPEKIYRQFAEIISSHQNSSKEIMFASVMVQTLNLIMLTSKDLISVRTIIQHTFKAEENFLFFEALFGSWSSNPISCLCICFLSKAYKLASALVLQLANTEPTVGFLMQLDKLIQLLESPIFIDLRLEMLSPLDHPHLIKALYGLLMILPQGKSYVLLNNRLQSVSSYQGFYQGQLKSSCNVHSSQEMKEKEFCEKLAPLLKKEDTQCRLEKLLKVFKVRQQAQNETLKKTL